MRQRLGEIYLRLWAKGLRQADLAKKVGISETTLCQIMTGRIVATEDEMIKIASALECDPDELFPYWKGGLPCVRS